MFALSILQSLKLIYCCEPCQLKSIAKLASLQPDLLQVLRLSPKKVNVNAVLLYIYKKIFAIVFAIKNIVQTIMHQILHY